MTLRHPLQDIDRLSARLVVQRAEALVNEHDIEPDRRGALCDHVRHAKCKGQRRHERLAPGERPDLAFLPGHRREHTKIKAPVSSLACLFIVNHPQLVLPRCHLVKTRIGCIQDPFQIISLHVRLNIHPRSGDIAGEKLIEPVDAAVIPGSLLPPRPVGQ